jgi:hypothetical protein
VAALLASCAALAQEAAGALLALGVGGILGLAGLVSVVMAHDPWSARWAFLHPLGGIDALYLDDGRLWRLLTHTPWQLERFQRESYVTALERTPAWSILLMVAAGLVLLRAACRKLAEPARPILSKPQAVLLFGMASVAVIVPFAFRPGGHWLVLVIPLFPLATLLALLATPSRQLWTRGLREGVRPLADGASPFVAMLAMLALFGALVARVPVEPYWSAPALLYRTLGWGVTLFLTMPLYLLYGATRFQAPAQRAAFAALIGVHTLMQLIAAAIVGCSSISDGQRAFLELAGLLAVVVPAGVLWRQRVLRRRVLSSARA